MAQPLPKYPQKKESSLYKGLLEIEQQIERILAHMKKDPQYLPDRSNLEKLSKEAFELIKKRHPLISKTQKPLVTAIIDLTEVPVMHPKMQRVAFEIALKDSLKNLRYYLENDFQ